MIKALHKAKQQAFGGTQITITSGPGVTVESDATAAARLDTEAYSRAREGNR